MDFYQNPFLRAVKSAVDNLKGSYAIEVISKLYPNEIIAVRKDSPLVIGRGKGENFIAFDIPADSFSYKRFLPFRR